MPGRASFMAPKLHHHSGISAPYSDSGRGPKYRRWDSSILRSLMLASRRDIRPSAGELPQFVAVAAVPLTTGVAAFVLEPHGDAIVVEIPQVLAQHVVEFALHFCVRNATMSARPTTCTSRLRHCESARIGQAHPFRVAGVPGVLGGLDLLDGGLEGERREGRTTFGHALLYVSPTATIPFLTGVIS